MPNAEIRPGERNAMRVPDFFLARLGIALAALLLVACSREPRNEFLVRFRCEFKQLDRPLSVTVDLARMRMALQTSPDIVHSVPLSNIDGQLVFENDPQNDQSLKLWMRANGSARLRSKREPAATATETTGTCRRTQ
jgi:hypothetical protein